MRKLIVVLTATAAVLLAGSLAFKADAQTSRGAAIISTPTQNFTPIEKAACGPHWGRWCGPFHRRVCGPWPLLVRALLKRDRIFAPNGVIEVPGGRLSWRPL